MSLLVPFNHRPFSTTARTGSYTIPTGYYARVVVDCQEGASFSIDGNTAISNRSPQSSNITSIDQTYSTTMSATFTVSSGYIFEGYALAPSTSTIQIDGDTMTHTDFPSDAIPLKLASGAQVSFSDPSNVTFAVKGYEYRESIRPSNIVQEIWVKEGQDLSETGDCRYTVELYPNYS